MKALIARLALGHPRLPINTPRPERVSIPQSSIAPISLVHLLMVSPFIAPTTLWNMMHTKADAVGMTQRVAPFLDRLRATAVEHQQVIAALTSVDLADSTISQRKGARTSLVPRPPYMQPPIQ